MGVSIEMMSRDGHPHGEQLSAYVDGMLDVGKTRATAEHLRACAPCRVVAEGLRETKSLLRTMPPPARPGPEFWTNSYRRLRVDDRERTQTRPMPWDFLREPGRATSRRWAAGLGVAAALGALLVSPLTGPREVMAPPVPVAVQQDVTPDVSALVQSHTDSVSQLPLADPDRQKMIAADAQQAPDAPEAAAYADGPF